MRILAAALCLLSPAALAQMPRMELLPDNGACFAVIKVENRAGFYNLPETFVTEHGSVTVKYQTIGGHNATDFDLIDVVDLPDGVLASPMHIDLPDGDTGFICLIRYLGG